MGRLPKILYAIQGTGNGHISRARDIVPLLAAKSELDVLISGIQADVQLPYPVKYRYYGLSFIFGKDGGVDLGATFSKAKPFRLWQEIRSLDINQYDLVISDFEPVSSWACYFAKKPCISLSHQAGVMAEAAPQPTKKDFWGKYILNHYAPATAAYGFHFKSYPPNVFTPVIRNEIRSIIPQNHGHYTVYLPAYSDEAIIKILSQISDTHWQVFSKHNVQPQTIGNIKLVPVQNDAFILSLATSAGVLCGAGFETPAEALFLGKKVMVIPMSNQYEQHCNAAGAAALGVPAIPKLEPEQISAISQWVNTDQRIVVDYPDQTEHIIDMVLANHL